jgi:hypothetical protein
MHGETMKLLHILCVCMYVSLGVQHAPRMCRMILASVACSAVPYISILSHKVRHFRKEIH